MSGPKILASVSRALTIVEYLAQADHDGLPLSVIATDLKINKATAYTTLSTLREHRWVEQVEATANYRLGEGISAISRYQTTSERVVELIRPTLIAISQNFNELVHLGRFTGYRIRYLDKVEPDRAVRVISRVGDVALAVRTGLGRALIGADPLRKAELDRYLSDPLLADEKPETLDALRNAAEENLRRLDEHGWTEEIGENQPGISCVAVPLYYEGKPDFAISITTPQYRMPEARRREFAEGIVREVMRLPEGSPFSVNPIQ
ncbi:IclR family transcriptional regulator [Actinomycetaceae bacterium L2_0104]